MANDMVQPMDVDDDDDDHDPEAFDMRFLDVGQGDCILIRCPDKRVVMIDCGSLSQFKPELKLKSQFYIRDWTDQNNNLVDVLIFTHSDQDHYNQALELLYSYQWAGTINIDGVDHKNEKIDAVTIKKLYFSSLMRKSTDKPLYWYSQAAINKNIHDRVLKVDEINEVTITSTKGYYETWKAGDSFKTSKGVTNIVGNRLTIMSGVTPKKTNWSISILAGNISAGTTGSAWDINTRSLVTLLQIGTHKALFCGDATTDTEAFLKAKHQALLTNIDLIKVAHHGSESSSADEFVTMTNPIGVAVSVANMEDSFRHPRYVVIKRWVDALNNNDNSPALAEHDIDYWVECDFDETQTIYQQWQKKGLTVTTNNSRTLSYLEKPPTNDFYAIHNQGFKLYRKKTVLNLWETATNTTIPWSLPQDYDDTDDSD